MVGLVHEQNRPYSPCIRQVDAWDPDWHAFGPYDPASIMTYCASNTFLSPGDSLALKALYGAPGSFMEENGAIYRYHLGQRCHVVGPQQMDAFGGAGLIGVVTNPDDFQFPLDMGECRWPDGFYTASNSTSTYFAIGGEGLGGLPIGGTTVSGSSTARLCRLESAAQLDLYGGTGMALASGVPQAELNRARLGNSSTVCPWPDGFYTLGSSSQIYSVTRPTYCRVASTQEGDYLGVTSTNVFAAPATAGVLTGLTGKKCTTPTFKVLNPVPPQDFAQLAAIQGARPVVGDFDNDGYADIALLGGIGMNYVPIAYSKGDGLFVVTKVTGGQNALFAGLSQAGGAKFVSGDFDNDPFDDIAIVGPNGWDAIRVGHGNGMGGFTVTVNPNAVFAQLAAQPGVALLAGKFDTGSRTDLALVGGEGWDSTPIALGSGNGNFVAYDVPNPDFTALTGGSNAQYVAADFDGDGRTDLAALGVDGWQTVPMAFFRQNPAMSFVATDSYAAGDLASWSKLPGVHAVAGTFSAVAPDPADIALVGGPAWRSIPIGFSQGDGTWPAGENNFLRDFPIWATEPGVKIVAADFTHDGRTDIALLGVNGWNTIPLAFRLP